MKLRISKWVPSFVKILLNEYDFTRCFDSHGLCIGGPHIMVTALCYAELNSRLGDDQLMDIWNCRFETLSESDITSIDKIIDLELPG